MRAPIEADRDPNKHWLGEVQPIGIVVTASALAAHALVPAQQTKVDTEAVLAHLNDRDKAAHVLRDPWAFLSDILDWRVTLVAGSPGGPDIPDALRVHLSASETILEPHLAVAAPGGDGWQLLVRTEAPGLEPDKRGALPGWEATPHQRFERLLRDTGVPTGLLMTDETLRMVYAPKGGESSGWFEVPLRALGTVAGRSMLGGIKLLLDRYRLFGDAAERRLPALLEASRRSQSEVSTKLATQVLGALHALMHGLHAASPAALSAITRDQPAIVYEGLLAVLLRLVFLLYAEDRGLIPSRDDPMARAFYEQGYGVRALHTRLLEDAALHPDTMEERRGAWHRLLALFRLVHEGDATGWMRGRGGKLFDPKSFPFLQGQMTPTDPVQVPLVSDACVLRVLDGLLTLDGERLSYRALDVEQIGSVYETVMGFTAQIATGPSLAIRAGKKERTPVFVDLTALAAIPGKDRLKWLKENTERSKFPPRIERAIAAAQDENLLATALFDVVDERGSPGARVCSVGTPLLQPTDERRRTGSHYTPRDLTAPIVMHALAPALKRIGPDATPEAVLSLKVCDPAMGSGAFLVEACRQLAARLVDAWRVHQDKRPALPPDEDEELHAKRLVAQRCLYGVDRNPMATDLARLSLWLATLARDHEFTFLDHALKSGDSLVGLTARQIGGLRWKDEQFDVAPFDGFIRQRVRQVTEGRSAIREAPDDIARAIQEQRHREVEGLADQVRLLGDATLAAFFGADKARARETARVNLGVSASLSPEKSWPRIREAAAELAAGQHPITPFHWEIEFPEVFTTFPLGFDAVVGNPPFLSGTIISNKLGMRYFQYLTSAFEPARHHCDLVGYFFRRIADLLSRDGTFGLIATNTISQGDTREGSLKVLLSAGARITRCVRRVTWPGEAAVQISIIHITKSREYSAVNLDGRAVDRISAFLVEGNQDGSPLRLAANPYFSLGVKIYGQGFLFDDSDEKASKISVYKSILKERPDLSERIFKYVGGEDLNASPSQQSERFAIYLSDIAKEDGLQAYSPLADIVREKVRPERMRLGNNPNNKPLKDRWWAYQAHRPDLQIHMSSLSRVIVISQVTTHLCFSVVETKSIFSHKVVVIASDRLSLFATVQSRLHEVWVRMFTSTLEDRLNYSASDFFQTFPLPENWSDNAALSAEGKRYHDYRGIIVTQHDEGLTKTYNRFHDPDDRAPDIQRLRDLHHEIDVAVLRAYGWDDLADAAGPEFLTENTEQDHRYQDRLFWPEAFRDEVLSRLLTLNADRAADEAARGLTLPNASIGADELEEV